LIKFPWKKKIKTNGEEEKCELSRSVMLLFCECIKGQKVFSVVCLAAVVVLVTATYSVKAKE